MTAFFTSLIAHLIVAILLFMGSSIFSTSSTKELKTIRVAVVPDSQAVAPAKTLPPKESPAEEERPATTKLAAYNLPNTPTKRDHNRPETLLPPPKKQQQETVSLAKPPTAKPAETPAPKKRLRASKTESLSSSSNQEQPIAAPPKRRPKNKKTLASILKSLQERDNSAITSNKTKSAKTKNLPKENTTEPSPSQKTASAIATENPITATDLATLNRQLSSCWTIISTDGSLYQPVKIRLYFDEKLHVRKLEFVERDKFENDPRYRVAAEQAQSAILHPACQPLALPKEKISPDVILLLNFNPQTTQR